MPIVKLKRKTEPTITGVQYNGLNVAEVVQFYAYRGMTVTLYAESMTLVFLDADHGEKDTLRVGDWIINENNQRFINTAEYFNRNYVSEPPKDHKVIDTATGKEIHWKDG